VIVTGGGTVTVKVPLLTLPAASVAVTVTVVVPIGNTVPLAFEYVIVGLALKLSVAVAAGYVTTAPLELVALAITFAGTLRTGSMVSRVPILESVTMLDPEACPWARRNPT